MIDAHAQALERSSVVDSQHTHAHSLTRSAASRLGDGASRSARAASVAWCRARLLVHGADAITHTQVERAADPSACTHDKPSEAARQDMARTHSAVASERGIDPSQSKQASRPSMLTCIATCVSLHADMHTHPHAYDTRQLSVCNLSIAQRRSALDARASSAASRCCIALQVCTCTQFVRLSRVAFVCAPTSQESRGKCRSNNQCRAKPHNTHARMQQDARECAQELLSMRIEHLERLALCHESCRWRVCHRV